MNPIRRMFGKMFHQAPKPVKVVKPKDEHYTVPAPRPKRFSLRRAKKVEPAVTTEKPTSFGTCSRLKHICGHPVRPLLRAQKRDLEKLYGVKLP